jgi:hypothetical protein
VPLSLSQPARRKRLKTQLLPLPTLLQPPPTLLRTLLLLLPTLLRLLLPTPLPALRLLLVPLRLLLPTQLLLLRLPLPTLLLLLRMLPRRCNLLPAGKKIGASGKPGAPSLCPNGAQLQPIRLLGRAVYADSRAS